MFKPIDIPDDKLSTSDIRLLLDESKNESLHWGYPFLELLEIDYVEQIFNDGILYNFNSEYVQGIFLYYDSGLFVNYQNLIEDMRYDGNTTLNVYYLIAILTRAYRFAAKLSKHKIYNGKISLEFTLHKQKGRVLSFEMDSSRPYSSHQCSIDDIYDEQPEIVTKETLEIKSDELAIKRAMNMLEKYGSPHRYLDKKLRQMQKIQDEY